MVFLDRSEELGRLRGTTGRGEGCLVVVWGRRRVGKTRLLLEWAGPAGGLYWVADESNPSLQRRYLAEALGARLPGFGEVEYRDFGALLSRLGREARLARWRGPLILDELPYLVAAAPELPAALQRFVDHELPGSGLVLALCGSSQRMMQGLTLDGGAPLYGRARELLKVRPLPIGHLGAALRLRDPTAIVRSFAAWGGIPRYWELAQPFADVGEAVEALVLDPLGPLHEEPVRLLLDERPPALTLRPLLDAIGGGAHRLSEIGARIGQPATSLARPLQRLQELDLVVREAPFGEPERSGKRSLYKLADPLLRLWFSVVAPKRSLLVQAPRRIRRQLFDQAAPRLCALTWEELCRAAVPRLGESLGGLDFGPARRFWLGSGPEWDVVAQAPGGELLLGEVKWSATPPTVAEVEGALHSLLGKGLPPGLGSGERPTHRAIFVPRLPRGLRRRQAERIHFIDAGDLLAVLR